MPGLPIVLLMDHIHQPTNEKIIYISLPLFVFYFKIEYHKLYVGWFYKQIILAKIFGYEMDMTLFLQEVHLNISHHFLYKVIGLL